MDAFEPEEPKLSTYSGTAGLADGSQLFNSAASVSAEQNDASSASPSSRWVLPKA